MVQSAFRGDFDGYFACLPHAWYVWEQITDDDIVRRQVLIFENQVDGFQRLSDEILEPRNIPHNWNEDYAAELLRRYFGDLHDPLPSVNDLWALIDARQEGYIINYYTFEDKRRFDPHMLAEKLKDMPPAKRVEHLQIIFNEDPVCRLVYQEDFEALDKDVREEIERIIRTPVSVISEPEVIVSSQQALRSWGEGEGHNLTEIWNSVTTPKLHFPQGIPHISDLRFSDADLKTRWGFYRHKDRVIVISKRLNSPDVPCLILEFLLYHLLLHADMPNSKHNSGFRQRERKRFTPSATAIDEWKGLGLKPGDSSDEWRVRSEQYLATFNRRYLSDNVELVEHPIY